MSARADAWKATWDSRDASAIVAMYAPDATHMSGQVAVLWPELGRTTLRGHHELGEVRPPRARASRGSASIS